MSCGGWCWISKILLCLTLAIKGKKVLSPEVQSSEWIHLLGMQLQKEVISMPKQPSSEKGASPQKIRVKKYVNFKVEAKKCL